MRPAKEKYHSFLTITAIAFTCSTLFFISGCSDSDSDIENAVEEVADGFEDAADELDPNRSPAEEITDEIEEAGDELQDAAE